MKMMTKLIQFPGWAEDFYEHMFTVDLDEKEEITMEKIKVFVDEIRGACTPDVFKSFTRLLEHPLGAEDVFKKLSTLNLPHWDEIEVAMAPLRTPAKRARVELFPGCRSRRHSQIMYELTEFPETKLLAEWDAWNKILEEGAERRRISLEAKKLFKNGDRVRFTSGTWAGRSGILRYVSDHHQCTVKEDGVRGGICGFYHELELV